MFNRKIYWGLAALVVVSLGGFLLLSPREALPPVKIYKAVQPTLEKSQAAESPSLPRIAEDPHTAVGGKKSVAEPMSERDQLLSERDQLLSERDQLLSERDQLLSERDQLKDWRVILEAGKAEIEDRQEIESIASDLIDIAERIVVEYSDVLDMSPKKFSALSATQRDQFLLRASEYDLAVEEYRDTVLSAPQWIQERFENRRPGFLVTVQNLLTATSYYGGL